MYGKLSTQALYQHKTRTEPRCVCVVLYGSALRLRLTFHRNLRCTRQFRARSSPPSVRLSAPPPSPSPAPLISPAREKSFDPTHSRKGRRGRATGNLTSTSCGMRGGREGGVAETERDIQANDVQAKSFKGNEIGARFEAVQPFQPGFNDISRERRFTAAINAYSLRCASAVLITMYRKSKITG